MDEDLTRQAAGNLHMLLTDALDLRPEQLVVDLSGCTYADALAVDVLLNAHRRAWSLGSRLTLRGPTHRVLRLLQLTRTDQVFNVTAVPETAGRPSHWSPRP